MKPTIKARDIFKNTGVQNFTQWIKQGTKGFQEGKDYTRYKTIFPLAAGGHTYVVDYLCSPKMAERMMEKKYKKAKP